MGNVKDRLYIEQRYYTQVNKNHDNFENVLIYFQRMQNLLFIAAVRSVSLIPNKNFLLLCGDREKNPGPYDASKLSFLDDAIVGAQNCFKFLFFNIRSKQNKYPDISHLLQQLDLETIVIVTKTWTGEEQSWNINLSPEHSFLRKNRSHQTRVAKGGGVGIWIPKKKNFKCRREFELADPNFFETLWLELSNPLTEKCLINIFIVHSKAWVTSF